MCYFIPSPPPLQFGKSHVSRLINLPTRSTTGIPPAATATTSMNNPQPLFLFTATLLAQLLICGVTLADTIQELVFYPEERDALLQLRDTVNSSSNLHANWTGPPCHKNLSQWSGIACFNWHVTHLVLEGINLTGPLPPTFLLNLTFLSKISLRNNSINGTLPKLTNLVYLEVVFLSSNKFSGPIPLDYIHLPKLTKLELQENDLNGQIPPFNQPTLRDFNVSYNQLSGQIPETSVLERFPKSSFDHNLDLCGSVAGMPCPVSPVPEPSPSSNGKKRPLKVWSIVLIAAAAALVPFLVMLIFVCYYRRVHDKEANEVLSGESSKETVEKKMDLGDPERTVELQFFNRETPVFDLDDLLRASAELLGKGKLGTTYKAMLESGLVVAVKRLKNMSGLSKKEFIQQMQLLGKMRHENLVEIISFYYSKEEKLVIYEYLPHGSLFELLHENRGIGRVPLNWTKRLSIIKDIAKGLSSLHQTLPSHKVPHANLKSSNVFIHRPNNESHYHAKLSDFGFLPLLPSRKASEKLAIAKSPEFCDGKKLTYKADVYCFGIILLEIITGKIPGEISGQGDDEGSGIGDLSDWVRTVVNNDWSTDILDMEILAAKDGHNEMLKFTELALECTDMVPEKRPKMSLVLRRIAEIEVSSHEQQRESVE
ncbi:hypothetical protein LguiA_027760 [Lonicera macranthoides]